MIRSYSLGYCDGPLHELDQIDIMLGRDRGRTYFLFRHRLIFPLPDHVGRVIGFAARTLGNDDPKYVNSPESPIFHKGDRLYGLTESAKAAMRARGRAVVVEGYTDVMRAQGAGLEETVCSMGTAFTPVQAEVLSRYTDTVITLFDGDAAGMKATTRAAQVLKTAGLKHGPAALPNGLDPDEYLAQFGAAPLLPYLADIAAAATVPNAALN